VITIEEGRKLYNEMRTSRDGSRLELRMKYNHEAAVEAFLAQCEAERPVETAIVFAKYPVLTERQLEDRRATELHAFGPESEDEAEFEPGLNLTGLASIEAHRDAQERAALARRRGEPV